MGQDFLDIPTHEGLIVAKGYINIHSTIFTTTRPGTKLSSQLSEEMLVCACLGSRAADRWLGAWEYRIISQRYARRTAAPCNQPRRVGGKVVYNSRVLGSLIARFVSAWFVINVNVCFIRAPLGQHEMKWEDYINYEEVQVLMHNHVSNHSNTGWY